MFLKKSFEVQNGLFCNKFVCITWWFMPMGNRYPGTEMLFLGIVLDSSEQKRSPCGKLLKVLRRFPKQKTAPFRKARTREELRLTV